MSSANVDERIVEMQFDNEEFEKDVSTTMGTLAKLKESLSFANVKDGFERIQNGIANTNFGPIQEGLAVIQDRFGLVEMIALNALDRISNSILDMGQNLVNAIAIDPVKSGFQEYETQIGAIQTIMANTEEAFKNVSEQEHLDAVNNALDELNHYADKTIYNFTEMTRNIGTFTAAGVSLETSTNSIQGIANVAALSGSNSEQASRAMYQLSQAIASGSLKLQDWNSVVNASMGGQVFQNALKESSRALAATNEKVQELASSGKSAEEISNEMGISLDRVNKLLKDEYNVNVDECIEKAGNFRESLKNEWITTEVLTDALRNFTFDISEMSDAEKEAARSMLSANGYTDEQIEKIFMLSKSAVDAATKVKTFSQLIDTLKEAMQSGWTQSWEYIIGDFGEAKALFTGISNYLGDIINDSANARNAILEQWHDSESGGRAVLLEGLKNSILGLISVASIFKKHVGNFFAETFGTVNAEVLINITKKIKALGEYLTFSDEKLQLIDQSIVRILSPLSVVSAIIKNFKTESGPLLETLGKLGGVFKDLYYYATRGIELISKIVIESGAPYRIAKALVSVLSGIGNVAVNAYYRIKELISAFTGLDKSFFAVENGVRIGRKLVIIFYKLRDQITLFSNRLGELKDIFVSTVEKLTGVNLDKVFSWENVIEKTRELGEYIRGIPKYVTDLKNTFSSDFSEVVKRFNQFTGLNVHKPTWEEFIEFLTNTKTVIAGWGQNLVNAKNGIGDFFNVLYTKTQPIRDKFNEARIAVVNFFKSFRKEENPEVDEGIEKLSGIAKIANAIKDAFEKVYHFLAGVIAKIWAKIKELTANITFDDIIEGFVGGAGTIGLLQFAQMLGNITKTLKGENFLSFFEEIIDGLKGAVDTFKEIIEPFGDTLEAFQNKLKADMLKNIALAVAILVGSLIAITFVDEEKLQTGILAIGMLMGELLGAVATFTKYVGSENTKAFSTMALGFIQFAAAIDILAIGVKAFSEINVADLVKGLLGVGYLMGMLVAASYALKDIDKDSAKSIKKISSAMILLAIAVRLLVKPVKQLGEVPIKQLAKGLIGVGTLIGALTLFARFSEANSVGIRSGVGIVLLAVAIKSLANTTLIFSELSWESIAKGLAGVAGILAALGLFTRFSEAEKVGLLNGVGLLLLSKAITSLVESTLPFTRMRWERIGKGLAGVAGILAALGLFTRFSDANSFGLLNGVGLLLLAKSIEMLMNIAIGFSELPNEQLLVGFSSLIGLIAALGLFTKAMDGVNVLGIGSGLVIVSLAINLLVLALKASGELPLANIGKGLLAVAGVLGVLVVAGYLLTPVIGVLLKLSTAMLMVGAATVLFGTGVVILEVAVGILEKFKLLLGHIEFAAFIQNVRRVFELIIDIIPYIIKAITEFIKALLEHVATLAPAFWNAVVAIGKGVIFAIRELAPPIVAAVIELLYLLLNAVNDNIYNFSVLSASIVTELVRGLIVGIPAIASAGQELIIGLINGMSQALIEHIDQLMQALENLLGAISYALLSLLQEITKGLPFIGGVISDGIQGIKDDIKEKVNFEEGQATTNDLMDGVKAGIQNGIDPTREATNGLTDSINEGLKKIDTSAVGESVKNGVIFGMTNAQGDAENTAGLLGAGVTNVLNNYDSSSGGFALAEKVMSGMGGSFGDAEDKGEDLGFAILSGVTDKSVLGDYENAGSDYVDQITNGMLDPDSLFKMKDAGSNAADSGKQGLDSQYPNFVGSGSYLMDGAANGIYGNVKKVVTAASYAGTKAHEAYNIASGVSSPSWKFAQSGYFQMLGGANGIMDNVGLLTTAAKFAGDETVDSFNDSITRIGENLHGDFDDNLKIRPVIDLDGVYSGINQIDSIFSRTRARAIDFNATSRLNVQSAVNDLGDITNKSNRDISSKIDAQIDMMDKLISLLANQRIYLDGKTMVGGMIGEVDKQLGQRQILAGRRGNG